MRESVDKVEIWKGVVGYEEFYEVSSLGRVRSLDRKIPSMGVSRILHGKVLSHGDNTNGYDVVVIYGRSKSKTRKVHQLVVESFLGHIPCGHKKVVDHINGIKTDNRLENLRIVTQRENASRYQGGTSKFTGVSWVKSRKKWAAQIVIDNKTINLGHFVNEIDAHNAYQAKLKSIL